MTMQIKDRIEVLRRTYPYIDPASARFMYATAADMSRRGKRVALYIVMWASDGRVTLKPTTFEKKRAMSVPEWAGWLRVNAPYVLANPVLAHANRMYGQAGTTWNIDRVFGWHFAKRKARK